MKKRLIMVSVVSLLIVSLIINGVYNRAYASPLGPVSFATSANTVLTSGGYYSANPTMIPSPSTVDVGVDPTTIQRVEVQDTNGNTIAQLTQSSGSIYSLPQLSGTPVSVIAKSVQSYSGYFMWLRNTNSNDARLKSGHIESGMQQYN